MSYRRRDAEYLVTKATILVNSPPSSGGCLLQNRTAEYIEYGEKKMSMSHDTNMREGCDLGKSVHYDVRAYNNRLELCTGLCTS